MCIRDRGVPKESEFWIQRRKFSCEFMLEAVKLVRDRGVTAVQAAQDLDLHENVSRK